MKNKFDWKLGPDIIKKTIVVILILIIVISVEAQSRSINSSTYRTALGVKVWDGGGITFKHFFTSTNAGELIGYFWNRGTRLTGLYEIHGFFADASGLK